MRDSSFALQLPVDLTDIPIDIDAVQIAEGNLLLADCTEKAVIGGMADNVSKEINKIRIGNNGSVCCTAHLRIDVRPSGKNIFDLGE